MESPPTGHGLLGAAGITKRLIESHGSLVRPKTKDEVASFWRYRFGHYPYEAPSSKRGNYPKAANTADHSSPKAYISGGDPIRDSLNMRTLQQIPAQGILHNRPKSASSPNSTRTKYSAANSQAEERLKELQLRTSLASAMLSHANQSESSPERYNNLANMASNYQEYQPQKPQQDALPGTNLAYKGTAASIAQRSNKAQASPKVPSQQIATNSNTPQVPNSTSKPSSASRQTSSQRQHHKVRFHDIDDYYPQQSLDNDQEIQPNSNSNSVRPTGPADSLNSVRKVLSFEASAPNIASRVEVDDDAERPKIRVSRGDPVFDAIIHASGSIVGSEGGSLVSGVDAISPRSTASIRSRLAEAVTTDKIINRTDGNDEKHRLNALDAGILEADAADAAETSLPPPTLAEEGVASNDTPNSNLENDENKTHEAEEANDINQEYNETFEEEEEQEDNYGDEAFEPQLPESPRNQSQNGMNAQSVKTPLPKSPLAMALGGGSVGMAALLSAQKSQLKVSDKKKIEKEIQPSNPKENEAARRKLWIEFHRECQKLQIFVKPWNCYSLKQVLGRGKFAMVQLAIPNDGVSEDGNVPVALKIAQYAGNNIDQNTATPEELAQFVVDFGGSVIPSMKIIQEFQREVQAASALTHPAIVSMCGILFRPLALVMEYANRGSLADCLQDRQWQVNATPAIRMQLLSDIVSGLMFMHKSGYVHRDLKAHNILLSDVDGAVTAKIGDLGTAIKLSTQPATSTDTEEQYGTSGYTAPEILRGSNFDFPADVYSFAVVTWELFTNTAMQRSNPLCGLDPDEAVDKIEKGLRPPLFPECHSELIQSIVSSGWIYDPNERPSMSSVFQMLLRDI